MKKRIISSTKMEDVEKAETPSVDWCAEITTKENSTLVGRQNQTSYVAVRGYVVLASRTHKIISSLVTALYYYHQDTVNSELPESFSKQCVKYLCDLCSTNDLMMDGLAEDLDKVKSVAKSI